MKNHVIEKFGGLNLLEDEQETQGVVATDLLNVSLAESGRILRREGLVVANDTQEATLGYNGLFPSQLNGGVLLASRPTGTVDPTAIDRLAADGTLTELDELSTVGVASIMSSVDFGTPTSQLTFFTVASLSSDTNDILRKYDGAAIAIAAAGSPRFVAVSPRANRLVGAHYHTATSTPSGANGSKSTVFFSNEGAPETYTATNFVHLRPGDGEEIVGMEVLGDLLLVFKQTAMFVFYGENTDDEGLTEFAFREVSLGEAKLSRDGSTDRGTRRIAAGEDGIYLSTWTGIYHTTGGRPDRITGSIDLLYSEPGDDYASDISIDLSAGPPRLSWARRQLFGSYTASNGDELLLVWWPNTGQWSIWRLVSAAGSPAVFIVSWPQEAASTITADTAGALYMVLPDASLNDIYRTSLAADDDDGTAFDWRYQSSFYRLGNPIEKRLRFTDVYGAGTATVTTQARGGRSGGIADAGAAVILGTIPAVARARRRHMLRGRMFAHRLSGTSTDGPTRINSIEHFYAESSRTT